MQLTSTKNAHLQAIRRAVADGRPTDEGQVVIEGPHLLEEALKSKWRIEEVLVTPAAQEKLRPLLAGVKSADIVEVTARAFRTLTGTETSQEVLALVKPRAYTWQDCLAGEGIVVVLDGIQDPGNAGAIVRSAEAFGAASVLFLSGCVRVANGKLLRATAGSMFRVPYLEGVEQRELCESGRKLYALAAHSETQITDVKLAARCALVVGSEAHGVSKELKARAQGVAIATRGVESLNAAVACSIALFEAARQKGAA